jgi:hypothetical protein
MRSVTTERVSPVAISLTVTAALGSAAPEGSLMSPTNCPVDAV